MPKNSFEERIGEWVDIGDGYEAIVLNDYTPWKEKVHSTFEDHLPAFVIYHDANENDWKLIQVPAEPDSYAPVYMNLPKKYQGLRGEELRKVSGIDDAIFVHHALWMGISSSKEGAIELARHAVREA